MKMKEMSGKAWTRMKDGEGIFQFLRAQLSSQLSTLLDFVVTILVRALFGMYYVGASFIGSVCGGIFNCIVNYKWVFHSRDKRKRYVAMKFLIVWIGSIFLNTGGTYLLTESLRKIPWVRDTLQYYFEDYFLVPKIIVAVLVGFLWNYQMQRLFVYRPVKFSHNKETDI